MPEPTNEIYCLNMREVDFLHDFLFEHGWSLKRFAEESGYPISTVYDYVPRFYKTGVPCRSPQQRRIMRKLQQLVDRLQAEDEAKALMPV